VYPIWIIASLAVVAIGLFFLLTARPERVFEETFTLVPRPPGAAPAKADDKDRTGEEVLPAGQETVPSDKGPLVVDHFIVRPRKAVAFRGGKNIRVTAYAPTLGMNEWVDVEGSIIDDGTLVVQPFEIPLDYSTGVEDGEQWTNDEREGGAYLSA